MWCSRLGWRRIQNGEVCELMDAQTPEAQVEEAQVSISLEMAYLEACQALGEEVVKSRIMSKALAEAQQVLQAREEARTKEANEGVTDGVNGSEKSGQHGQNGKVPESAPK